ncbi:FecR family protein [Pedobacter sp. N23S346]|uniref:FecR family protein n=1 Tax=Pedobacter sp. N23S346 TaxID=3402750 RepID=UPI003ACC0C0F
MRVSEELLNRYFQNKCTPEEKLLVATYLEEIEDLPDHLLTRDEWDDLQDADLIIEESDALFENIKSQTIPKNTKALWLRISAVAAIITIIVTAGLIFFNQHHLGHQTVKRTNQVAKLPTEINWKSIVNYTEENQLITLPDLSTVKIYPGGELRYAIPFVQRKREVYLQGKSFFKVSKDKKHPFIVYANSISTTALGTSFTITAGKESKLFSVVLHTGKIWVKNIDSTTLKSFSKILVPGNELVYNRIDNKLKVINPHLLLHQEKIIAELSFNQVPLATVLEKLAQHFEVKINYNPQDLQEISFTGSVHAKQSPHQILKELTELNELTLTKTATGYLIQKETQQTP